MSRDLDRLLRSLDLDLLDLFRDFDLDLLRSRDLDLFLSLLLDFDLFFSTVSWVPFSAPPFSGGSGLTASVSPAPLLFSSASLLSDFRSSFFRSLDLVRDLRLLRDLRRLLLLLLRSLLLDLLLSRLLLLRLL